MIAVNLSTWITAATEEAFHRDANKTCNEDEESKSNLSICRKYRISCIKSLILFHKTNEFGFKTFRLHDNTQNAKACHRAETAD